MRASVFEHRKKTADNSGFQVNEHKLSAPTGVSDPSMIGEQLIAVEQPVPGFRVFESSAFPGMQNKLRISYLATGNTGAQAGKQQGVTRQVSQAEAQTPSRNGIPVRSVPAYKACSKPAASVIRISQSRNDRPLTDSAIHAMISVLADL